MTTPVSSNPYAHKSGSQRTGMAVETHTESPEIISEDQVMSGLQHILQNPENEVTEEDVDISSVTNYRQLIMNPRIGSALYVITKLNKAQLMSFVFKNFLGKMVTITMVDNSLPMKTFMIMRLFLPHAAAFAVADEIRTKHMDEDAFLSKFFEVDIKDRADVFKILKKVIAMRPEIGTKLASIGFTI